MSGEQLTRRVRVGNKDGLHLRAAALLSQQAQRFPCDIRITCGDRQADAKSIWELIGLLAEPGCELLLQAAGSQAEAALDRLEDLVVHQFQVPAKEDCRESC
jgi:phosphocarrier protein